MLAFQADYPSYVNSLRRLLLVTQPYLIPFSLHSSLKKKNLHQPPLNPLVSVLLHPLSIVPTGILGVCVVSSLKVDSRLLC
jgi:hypothetical protein